MAKYLLIESRDPFEVNEVNRDYELASNLARAGNEVTLFLVQNGVLPVRRAAAHDGLRAAIGSGVDVRSDEFSLRERGIAAAELAPGIEVAALDVVVDQLAEGRKAIWL